MSATVPGPAPGPVPVPMGMNTPELGSIPGLEINPGHGPGPVPGPSRGPRPADSYSIRAEVHKRNNRDLTEHGRQLGQYVRDLYNAGGKLFDKETFRETEEAVAVVPRPAIIQIRSMNGQYRHKYVPKEGYDPKFANMGEFSVDNWRLSASFTIAQSLIYQAEEKNLDFDDEDDSRPWTVKPALDDEDRALATRAFTLARSGERFLNTPHHVLRAAWDETKSNWQRSRTCKELLVVLQTIQCPANATKMICFGLGSLDGSENWETLADRADSDGLPLRAAMTQHCAALTMAAAFGAQIGKPPLKVMAQDPAYSPGQIALLNEVGIEVIPGIGALGFTLVEEDTIVFSCHPDVPVKQIIADIAKPAGMIWDAVKPAERERSGWELREAFGTEVICSPWVTDEDSVRTRELITGYDKVNFPYERERFGRLEIYLRKPE